jgi:hypothetical protein
VAISSDQHKGEVTQAPILLGGLIQDNHRINNIVYKIRGEPEAEDDNSTPGSCRTLLRNRSGRAAGFREEATGAVEEVPRRNGSNHRRTSLVERTDGDAPLGHSERIAFRKEQCNTCCCC